MEYEIRENGQVMVSGDGGVSWTHYDMEYHIELKHEVGMLMASIYNYLNEPQNFDGVDISFEVDDVITIVKSREGKASLECADYSQIYVSADKYRGVELVKPVAEPNESDRIAALEQSIAELTLLIAAKQS